MNFTPQTIVRLLSGVPLDNTYKDTIDFANVSAQTDFFLGFTKKTYADFTYQRERSAIRVPAPYDSIIDCNYVMYLNSNYTNKYFYAFIVAINYLNPETSEVIIETDVMQTWMFDYTVKPSFIERETVANDNLFQHTIPEQLEFGDLQLATTELYSFNDLVIVVAYMPNNIDNTGGAVIDNVYTGLKYRWFDTDASSVEGLNSFIQSMAEGGYLSDIVSIFMTPKAFVSGRSFSMNISRNFGQLDGYTPRNKKLYCYPYNYFAVNNCTGSEHIYKYELFRNPSHFNFSIAYAFNLAAASNCHPMDYKGIEENWDEGVVLTGFPICSWAGNVFANWLARNKLSLGAQFISQGINVVSGIATGVVTAGLSGGIESAVGSVGQVLQSLAQIGDRGLYPYQIQGQVECDVSNAKWGRVGFEAKIYTVRSEYAKVIDEFFDMFGYRVNRVDVPNTKSRSAWNYVKTVEAKIIGKLPVEHLVTIKANYNRGITFWHGNYVGDYTMNNSIVNPPAPPVWPDPSDPPEPPKPPVTTWGYPMAGWQNHVTSEWGWRADPITGELKFHAGMDIGEPKGTPILAIAAGKATFVGGSTERGNYVDVQVDDTFLYRYQHCDEINVVTGDTITIEQSIATVGETGRVTGPHLHLEIYRNGTSVNPRDYIIERS